MGTSCGVTVSTSTLRGGVDGGFACLHPKKDNPIARANKKSR
jgi:hypothetical protein